jgi:ubiquinone biosynthesis protein UbiJ
MVSLRGLIRSVRPAIHAIPFLGKGLRYLKRLVLMPWNFHKLLVAWSDDPPAKAIRSAMDTNQDVVRKAGEKTTHDILQNFYETTRTVMRTQVTWSEWNAKSIENVSHAVDRLNGAMTQLPAEFQKELAAGTRAMSSDINLELSKLNDTHAACYDHIARNLRELVVQNQSSATKDEVAELKSTIARLEEQLETVLRHLTSLKVGSDTKDAPLRRAA